jgi:hypothetical protein
MGALQASAELRAQLALEGQCKEKDCGKGQESQRATHDETGTIVPNEVQHFASSFVLAITRRRWRSSNTLSPNVLVPPAAAVPTAAEQQN